jgi:dTDP-4-amino-4,6-dideoxygalactose transaminase
MMIPVTKSFLPSQKDYQVLLNQPWEDGWITNRGKLVLSLESNLQKYLYSNSMIVMTNGTLPLQIGIKALGITKEVITTPFSYIATSSAIVWEGCRPVFVDINPDYLTIDETQIEAAITKHTSAILVTHVFGNPCHVEEIQRIAQKHKLKVIYDAAHCFGVTYKGQSIFNFGDMSTCSFHATKLFHTGEGGAAFCNTKEVYDRVYYHHNFGHNGPEEFYGLGINAKMSELQAAMGLAVLPHISDIIELRGTLVEQYLKELRFNGYRAMKLREGSGWNNSYFPIVFDAEEVLQKAIRALNEKNIFPRRYFFPSLNTLSFLMDNSKMPFSESIANRIICLPLYHSLEAGEVSLITNIINNL